MAERILHLYTLKFPQGTHEAFLEPELPYLAAAFDEVRIFPWTRTDEPLRRLPQNVKVQHTDSTERPSASPATWMRLMIPNLGRMAYLKQLRYQAADSRNLAARVEQLQTHLSPEKQPIHYSYWMAEWATVLGLLAKQNSIDSYVTRVHGFDLYDERHSLNYQPNRAIQLNGLKKVFPISALGQKYLAQRLPKAPLELAYLGTEDEGIGPAASADKTRLISVARLVPLKRIMEMVEVLKRCTAPVAWTHIGDGPQMEELKQAIASMPAHITVELKGNMQHEEVMQLYRSEGYHAFISLSESEGLPVSMMEAISFGIPVFSTDVGGVHELVGEKTGILFPADLDHQRIAGLIDDLLLSGMASSSFREGVRRFWASKFSAEKNYPRFVERLFHLHAQ